MSTLSQWLFMVALQSTVLLTAFIGLLRWWHVNPFTKHTLSCTAITACMCLPLGVLLVPATITSWLARPASNPMVSTVVDTTNEPAEQAALPALPLVPQATAASAIQVARAQVPANAFVSIRTWLSWDRVIVALWAIGFLAMIATRLAAQMKLQQLVHRSDPLRTPPELREHLKLVFGQPASPRLRVIDHAFVPFVTGLLRPVIVLPTMLLRDMELLKQVVAHEQAHIHRLDTWGLLWQQIVTAVFWWQPLLKLINRELAAARESIADSYVVSQCDPVSYAENILRLAESVHRSRSVALAFLAQPPTLEERVRHVLALGYCPDDKRLWQCRSLAVTLATSVLFLCGGIAVQSQLNAREPAQEAKQTTAETTTNQPVTQSATQPSTNEGDDLLPGELLRDDAPRFVTGRVLSPTGETVNDCLLLTKLYTRDREIKTITTRTDGQGEFKLELPGNVSPYAPGFTWVYKPGYGLRAVAFFSKLARMHRWDNATIVLPVADRMTVQVRDPSGQPVANSVIEPIGYQVPNGSFSANSSEGLTTNPPAEIIDLVRVTTNFEGSVELNCFNSQLMGGLQATSDIYGTQHFDSTAKQDWMIQFSPVGSLRIKLVGADASKAKGSWLNLRTEPRQQHRPLSFVSAMTQVTFDGQSELVVPKLAEGPLQVWSWFWLERKEYLPLRPPAAKVSAGAETVVEVKLVPSIEVKGRVVLQDSMLPAKGVRLSIQGRAAVTDLVETDDQGNFSLYALPGPAQVSFQATGPDNARRYRLPKAVDVVVPQDSAMIVPDIIMEKMPEITVHIADASGQPLIATDTIMAVQKGEKIHPIEKHKTDSAGSFRTLLDLVEYEKNLRYLDPCSGYRFYLINNYNQQEPQASVPLKEIRRSASELWLQK